MGFLDSGNAIAGEAEGVAVVEGDPGSGGDVDPRSGRLGPLLLDIERLQVFGRGLGLALRAAGRGYQQGGDGKPGNAHEKTSPEREEV